MRAPTASRRSATRSSRAISQRQPKLSRVVAHAVGSGGSFGLHHPARRVPYRIETPLRPSSETYRFARSKTLGNGPKAVSQQLDSSHGVHRCPFTDVTVVCVHSRLDRRPGFVEGLPGPSIVPSLPFLPTSTVFSAGPRSEDRDLDGLQVCCTLQPVMGFARFQSSCTAFGRPRSWSDRFSKPFPLALTLRSFSLSGSCPTRHRASPSKESPPFEGGAFTEWRALPPLERRSPVRVATASSFASSTSGLCSTGESVAESGRCHPVRPDAPMGFGSIRSDVCRAQGADQPAREVVPPRRFQTVRASAATREWRGRQVLGLSGSERPMLVSSRRMAARRSGSLAARRLPRFRSAQPPRRATGSVDWRRSSQVCERPGRPCRAGLGSRRIRTGRRGDPEGVPSTGSVSPEGARFPVHRAQTPKSRSRPSAQPRRAGTGVRA